VLGKPVGTTAAALPVPVAATAPVDDAVPAGTVGAAVVAAADPAVGAAVGAAVVVTAQVDWVMLLSSRVTAPLRANTRPDTVAPVSSVAEVSAMMVPTKMEPLPKVAELVTCKNTLQAWAPLTRTTELVEAVTRVDDAWKMNTAAGLP
jgi:hypothetical protein